MDAKNQKYDRQLRLWAANGQNALESASICLMSTTPTACEILKNLILPGVGKVTIIDDDTVQQHDVDSSFFLDASFIGKSKASAVASLLRELNEDVHVTTVDKNPVDLLEDGSYFDQFSLVLATNLHTSDVLKLSDICHKLDLPFIHFTTKGLCLLFRIQAPDQTIIETHAENTVDLRLSTPFPELEKYITTIDLRKLDDTEHAHIPFVVILLQYVQQWKQQNGGHHPHSYKERNELKDLIRSGMRSIDEENFDEAIKNIWRLASQDTVPAATKRIFDDRRCTDINEKTDVFWIVARGIRDFMEKEGNGQLPLPGSLPDMKSDTSNYIELQKIYRDKALEDLSTVKQKVYNLLETLSLPRDHVPVEAIEAFCKNASHVQVLQYRTLREEWLDCPRSETIVNALHQSDENMAYYLLFCAASRFFSTHQRYPGTQRQDAEQSMLADSVAQVLRDRNISDKVASEIMTSEVVTKCITNFIRFGDKELANIASLAGGLVSQEVIKLLTRQYTPINNTCLFNGIASTSSVYEL